MLAGYQKVTLPDIEKVNDLMVELNKNQKTTEDRVLVFTMGDKKAYVSFKDLYGMVFVMADEEQQVDLMPARKTTVTKYIKQHVVKLKKSMHAGDNMVVNCSIDVPTTVEEGLTGILKKKNQHFIIR